MQTFLPSSDFFLSARFLDRKRLGKQRVEAKQLLLGQWPHHPASKMWKGYEGALAYYGGIICREWIMRGYKDTLLPFFNSIVDVSPTAVDLPPWLGDERLHASHRANLLRKDPEHYGQFGWTEEPAEGYWWPPVARIKLQRK